MLSFFFPKTWSASYDLSAYLFSEGNKFSISGTANLRIKNVSLDDDGMYTCRGENLQEVADATARLSVKGNVQACVSGFLCLNLAKKIMASGHC